MLNERLSQLFTKYDPVIQTLISEVLALEQANISRKQPHLKEQVDQIISRLSVKEQERMDKSEEENRRLI